MQKKSCFCLVLFALFFSTFGRADENDGDFSQEKVLFVSLGSVCEPAHQLRYCELRKAAFPFDWIVSMDGEALVEMLNSDFQGFLGDGFFTPFGPAGHLLHTRYHLEFLHDGNFNHRFRENLDALKEKYQRRIDRFRSLRDFKGKLVFLRYAYPYSLTDPNRFYHFRENLEITEEYALRLYEALASFFPNVDLYLVALNPNQNENFEKQKQLNDRVAIYKFPLISDLQRKINSWKAFFAFLSA